MASLKQDKERIKPMLATLSKTVPHDGEWIFEKKYDGYRTIASIKEGNVALWSRNGLSFLTQFPSLVKALESVRQQVILDGEVVAEDEQGRPSFSLLKKGEPLPKGFKLFYYIFDVIELDGHDLRGFSLGERKELLQLLLRKVTRANLIYSPTLKGSREEIVSKAKQLGWEGIIAKELDSVYLSAKRSASWRKIKFQQSQEAIIIGYTQLLNSRHYFGALVLAVHHQRKLAYIGNCGSGFTEQDLREIARLMAPLETPTKPFPESVKVANEKSVTWLTPKLIVEVSFSEWTPDGKMRHPVFKGLRDDKPLKNIEKETAIQ